MIETLSAVIQYDRTIGNIWDSLYAKHQLRDSDITLDRVYSMLSEFLIELKLNEEQEKITQIVTGSNNAQMKPLKPSIRRVCQRQQGQGPDRREKAAKEEKERSGKQNGDNHAMTIGNQMDVNMDITVQSIIPGDNQADARYAVQLTHITVYSTCEAQSEDCRV